MLVSFPHMGKMHLALEKACQMLEIPCIVPALPGPETLRLGQELAPEGSCLPFCLVLGNIREALEKGADSILMLGGSGPCRFGFFIYLAVQILKDAGYKFEPLIIDKGYHLDNLRMLQNSNHSSILTLFKAAYFGWEILVCEEVIARIEREYTPLVLEKTKFGEFLAEVRGKLCSVESLKEVAIIRKDIIAFIKNVPMYPAETLLKVGLIGDIYTLLEPYANHRVEEYLRNRGVVVYKEMSVSNWLPNILLPWRKSGYRRGLLAKAYPYLCSSVGGFGLETVANARMMNEINVDGIIQLFPLGCMPEIVARSALDKMCRDEKIPALYVTLDQHHSMTGFETRIEAFLDMLYHLQQKTRYEPA